MAKEFNITRQQRANGKEQQTQPERGTLCLELEWTESEWFEVWLQLVREGHKSSQN